MTRRSKRELERALEDLDPTAGHDGPTEIVIRETVVPSDWNGEDGDAEARSVSQLRVYRDAGGEWHTEQGGVDE